MSAGVKYRAHSPAHAVMNELRILVVDDDRLMLTLLVGVLRREGYAKVDRATGGKEAIAKFLQTRPDIVFMDIEMPEINGIETLKAIKEFGIVTQVVIVTASPTTQNVAAAQENGASGFLVKPVSPAKVTKAIEACQAKAKQEAGSVELFICE